MVSLLYIGFGRLISVMEKVDVPKELVTAHNGKMMTAC